MYSALPDGSRSSRARDTPPTQALTHDGAHSIGSGRTEERKPVFCHSVVLQLNSRRVLDANCSGHALFFHLTVHCTTSACTAYVHPGALSILIASLARPVLLSFPPLCVLPHPSSSIPKCKYEHTIQLLLHLLLSTFHTAISVRGATRKQDMTCLPRYLESIRYALQASSVYSSVRPTVQHSPLDNETIHTCNPGYRRNHLPQFRRRTNVLYSIWFRE